MSKRSKLAADLGGNMAESIAGALHGATPPAADPKLAGRARDTGGVLLAVDRIEPDPGQPRKTFDPDELSSLGASLRTHGQIQPVAVRWNAATETYWLIAGEKRWRAARLAGVRELRAVVLDEGGTLDAWGVRELQVLENALRSDPPPVEQAAAYRELMQARGWTGRQLAARLCVDPATVTRALALLGLGDDLKALVDAGGVPPSTAYEVAKIPDPERRKAVEKVVVETRPKRAEVQRLARGQEAEAPPAARPAGGLLQGTTFGGLPVRVGPLPAGASPAAAWAEVADLANRMVVLLEKRKGKGKAA